MIIRIQAEDGQDFIIAAGDGGRCVRMATSCHPKPQPDLEDFTIEEAQAIVDAIKIAIRIAEQEREYMEARNGD